MVKVNIRTKESRYFDSLIDKQSEVWWGNTTEAGLDRQLRRARMASELITLYDNPVVLELGCGAGMFSKCILEIFPLLRFIGCDISQKSIEKAKCDQARYKYASFGIADTTSLPYANETFDVVIGNSILHHISLDIALRECIRILKKNGSIWFSEPNMLNPWIVIEKNIHFIGKITQNTEDETAFFRWLLIRKLKKAGFQNISIQPFDFLHPLVPSNMIELVNKIGRILEKIAVLREIAGSLVITANK